MTSPDTTSGYTRRSLGFRLAHELEERAGRGELVWHTTVDAGRIVYVVTPGKMWAEPKPPTLRMTPGECADWLNIPTQT